MLLLFRPEIKSLNVKLRAISWKYSPARPRGVGSEQEDQYFDLYATWYDVVDAEVGTGADVNR